MRKQLMFFAALLLASFPIFAQDDASSSGESSGSAGGAGSGDFILEVTGTPFLGSSLLNFSEFRARYFLNDNMAVRLGMNMDLNNYQNTPSVVVNFSSYDIMPGFEYHLVNEEGFRTYAAADVLIGQRITSVLSSTGQSATGTTNIPSSPTANIGNRSYFQVGTRLSVGVEYYFGKRFYIGGEVGFQYLYRNNSDVFVDGELFQAGTTDNIGFFTTANSFKIGFKFLNF